MQVNCLGTGRFVFTIAVITMLNSFVSHGQTRGAYIVEKYFVNEESQSDFAQEKGMELSIIRSLDDGYYYLTNEWDADGTYTTGIMYDWEEVDKDIAFDFDITKDDESVHVYEFKWLFENKFDKLKGKATGSFIFYMDGCDHLFTCIITIKSENLVLRYDGYREEI